MSQAATVSPDLFQEATPKPKAERKPRAKREEVTQAVAIAEPAGQVVNADATSLMAVISRAASDPSTDVDKLERLMGLYERITDRGATTAYDEAFAEMQAVLPSIDETGRIVVKAKNSEEIIQSTSYAKQADINEVVKPILGQYGFGLSFRPGRTAEGLVSMTAILSHRLGHREEATVTLQQDGSGSKNSVQGVGSSLTYAKRYATIAILNISSRAKIDMDDDGQGSCATLYLSKAQIEEVQALMEDVGADRARFLQFMKADSIADIPSDQFDAAMAALEKKRGA